MTNEQEKNPEGSQEENVPALTAEEAEAMFAEHAPAPDQGLSVPNAIEPHATEIVPYKEEKVVGLERFRKQQQEEGRAVVPLLKLIQAMSDDFTIDEIPPGHFRNTLTGEDLGTETEIFPIGVFRWRRLFRDRQIYCGSNDAVYGVGDPGGSCFTCPLSKWHVIRENGEDEEVPNARTFRAKKNEEMVGPPCAEQYVFVCVLPKSEYEVPGALVFQKSSLKDGNKFYSGLEWSPETQVYRVSSAKTTNEKGTWYVPRISFSRKLNEEEINRYMPMKERLKNAIVDIEIEEEA